MCSQAFLFLKYGFLALTWLGPLFVVGQPLDSYDRAVKVLLPDTLWAEYLEIPKLGDKSNWLLDWFEQQSVYDPTRALPVLYSIVQGLKSLETLDRVRAEYFQLSDQLRVYDSDIDLKTQIERLELLLDLLDNLDAPYWEARVRHLTGVVLFQEGNLPFARLQLEIAERLLQGFRATHRTNYQKLQVDLYLLRAALATEEAPLDTARAWLTRSISLAESIEYAPGVSNAYLNLAYFADTIQAWTYFEKAIRVCVAAQDTFELSRQLKTYGNYCLLEYESSQSLPLLLRAITNLRLSLVIHQHRSCETSILLGVAYHFQAAHPDFFSRKDMLLDSATYFYQRTINLARSDRDFSCLKWALINLGKICHLDTLCEQRIEEIAYLNDSLFQEQGTRLTHAIRSREDFQQQQIRDRGKRTLLVVALFSLLVLTIVVSAFFRKRFQNERNRNKALKSRINQHFISNALLSINSLIAKGAKEAASNYLIDFRRLLRNILRHSDLDFIPLREEIETLQAYLSLEKLRRREKLNYRLEVDENLDIESLQVVAMMLQPFVENAVEHGIGKKSIPGMVSVCFSDKGRSHFECEIKDDGIGRKQAAILRAQRGEREWSFGMDITQRRLKQIKGAHYTITDLHPEDHQFPGTRVVIRFPKKLEKHYLWNLI